MSNIEQNHAELEDRSIEQESYYQVLTTLDDSAKARKLAGRIIKKGLAACVQLMPSVSSVYRWQGKILEEAEILLFIKTTGACLVDLSEFLEAEHPYEIPEILVFEAAGISESYAEWMQDECSPK